MRCVASSPGCDTYTVALAGWANAGKTTLFNALTGQCHRTANYPGTTVSEIAAEIPFGKARLRLLDLPGTATLDAASTDEQRACDVVCQRKLDLLVVILDATQLRRQLPALAQLADLQQPALVVLNKWDKAAGSLSPALPDQLAQLIGTPVVATGGPAGIGYARLTEKISNTLESPSHQRPRVRRCDYGAIEQAIEAVQTTLPPASDTAGPQRWAAITLLTSQDGESAGCFECVGANGSAARARARRWREQLEDEHGHRIDTLLAQARIEWANQIIKQLAVPDSAGADAGSLSDRFDGWLLRPWVGLPALAALLFLVFQATFSLGDPLAGGIEDGFGWLGHGIGQYWPTGDDSLLKGLLLEGVLGGVGTVLSFLPYIVLLFLAIAVLEASGIMPRAAFLMDGLLQRLGLPGKSLVPMMMGFGCTVPAILSTRSLETRGDRLLTILILPLFTCGGRLPIYAIFIAAFFPPLWRGPALWLVYLIGMVLAGGLALVLRATVCRGEPAPLMMDLPPYQRPGLANIRQRVWQPTWAFIRQAGTLILGISVVLWGLSSWPTPPQAAMHELEQQCQQVESAERLTPQAMRAERRAIHRMEARLRLEHSALAGLGRAIAPIFKPIGFDWRLSTALIGGFAAKEVFIAQLGVIFGKGEGRPQGPADFRQTLRGYYSPLQAVCVMLFMLIAMPCMATIATTRHETGSWGWAMLQLVGLTAFAWTVTACVYQVGSLMGA
jgi:ferrous iron transport protein B